MLKKNHLNSWGGIFLCLLIILFSCNSGNNNFFNKPKSSSDTIINKYAKGFRILHSHDTLILQVFNPWQGAENILLQYKLFHKSIAQNFIHKKLYIQIPVKKVICLSCTHVAYIDALGEGETITGVSGIKNIFNDKIYQKYKRNELFEVGYENNINYEKIISTSPDVVFAYGIGSEIKGYIHKLEKMGIPVVLVGEYLEEDPLGRAEWINFFAAFYDKLALSKSIFFQTDSIYNYWKSIGEQFSQKPTIMTSLPWNGTWYVSGSNTYTATLIAHAGGKYMWDNLNNQISIPLDFETIYQHCANSDFWINIGVAKSKKDILNIDKRLSLFKPYITGNLYNNNARVSPNGGNDYWETGVVYPHFILKDLINIFHNGINPNDSLLFYKKIY